MDLAADRFIALNPISATIWNGLTSGRQIHDLNSDVMTAKRLSANDADCLLERQFEHWRKAGLIVPATAASPRPLPEPLDGPAPATGEVDAREIAWHAARPLLLATLYATELGYRRSIKRSGLAATLRMLQQENGAPARDPRSVLLSTLGSYYVLRRAFRQGRSARDCLFRSLALASVLRRRGVRADVCIGVIDLPFSSHAWVEREGSILNETLEATRDYSVIARF